MSEESNNRAELGNSLRAVLPDLYQYIIDELALAHIHAYDIQANVIEETNGYYLKVHYGDQFKHTISQHLTTCEIANLDRKITEFITRVVDVCKQTMVQEYYKMMKM